MRETRTRRRSGIRTGVVLLALASLGVLLLALTPAANAGISGSNQLVVQLTGTGGGNVTQVFGPGNGTPSAINCSSAGSGAPSTGVCVSQVPFGAPPAPYVGLQANPPAGSEFAGWDISPADAPIVPNSCGLTAQCYVQIGEDTTVRALFNQAPGFPLVVIKAGPPGSNGSVTSNPAGINCGADCTSSYPSGTVVTLTAAPATGSTFAGWGGACSGSGVNIVCQVSVIKVTQAIANFTTQSFALTASVTGDGGIASNIQPGISCQTGNQGTCSANVGAGTQVVLTASADSGSKFTGWGGACSSSGTSPTCTVTMSQAQSVSATFAASAVQAEVTGNKVIYSSNNPKRVLQIKISAEETVNVKIQLQKGGVNYASRTYNGVDEGASALTVKIKNSVATGKYTAVVTFTNTQGAPPLVQNRNVKLKAVPS
jgi:Divergent InlB B-repeat domain